MNSILIFIFVFQLGFMPDNSFILNDNYTRINMENSFHAEFGIELLLLDHIFINAKMENYFRHKEGQLSFSPYSDVYNFGAGLRFDNFEIGIKHFCVHPVIGSVQSELNINGAITEIYIQIRGKIALF